MKLSRICLNSLSYHLVRYLISETTSWRYSASDPGNPGWINSIPSSWAQYTPGSFPPATGTRYYALQTTVTSSFQSQPVLEVDIFTHEGFILYLNGVEYNRFNLPLVGVSHSTTCTKVLEVGVWKRIRLAGLQFLSSSSLYVAIEVHGANTGSGQDDFKALVVPIAEGEMDRTVDLTVTSSIAPGSEDDLDNIVDGYAQTYLSITMTNETELSLTFTFNNDRREWFNRYMIQSSPSRASADPREWRLSASNDGSSWTQLDYRDNEVFSSRMERRTFELTGQMKSWNRVRLDIIARLDDSDDRLQMGDLFLLTVGSLQNQQVSLTYENVEDKYYVGVDSSIDLLPKFAGYTEFQINPALPAGLTFNTNNGHITGSVLESMVNRTVHTITATRAATGGEETYTLTLDIATCSLQTQSLVELRKYNVEGSHLDTFRITSSTGDSTIESFTGSNAVSTDVHRLCLAQGSYNLVLGSNMNFAWKTGSYVELYVHTTLSESIRVGSATLKNAPSQSFPFHSAVELYNTQTLFFLYNSTEPLASDWTTTAPSSTTWASFDPLGSSSITLNETVWFFRGQVYIDNSHFTSSLQSFFLDVYCRAGMVVYVNGQEIYRVNVAEGEITKDSTIMGGSQSPSWRRVVGLHSAWQVGNNNLAVILVNAPSVRSQPVDAKFRLYFSQSSGNMPHSYGIELLYSHQRAGYPVTNLGDSNYNTYAMMERAASNTTVQYWGVQFTDGSAALVNKYCFVNNGEAERWDPTEWEVIMSNDNTFNSPRAQSTTVFSWSVRNQHACFYLKDVSKPYRFYHFVLKSNSNQFPDNYYALSEIELYTVSTSTIQDVSLVYNPSVITGYFGYPITTIQPTTEGFLDCSSNPALPNGLSVDKSSGIISGVPVSQQASSSYQITCKSILGTDVSTSVTITIEACTAPNRYFSVQVPDVGEMGSNINFELKEGTATKVTRSGLLNYHSHVFTTCGSSSNLYQVKLSSKDANGINDRYASVQLADGSELFRLSASDNTGTTSIQFSPFFIVDDSTSWRYMYGQEPNLNWQMNNGTESWTSEEPGQFPVTDTITQYYITAFTLSSPSLYAGAQLHIRLQAGAIVYLNGETIFSANLPVNGITSQTLAESQYAVIQTRINSVANSNLLQESNTLAVEIHRGSTIPSTNSFNVKLVLLSNNQARLGDGEASSNRVGTEGHEISAAFDQNPNTFFNYEGVCVGTTLQWTFSGASQHFINSYTLTSRDCLHMMPTAWSIEGSREGEAWILLDVQTNQVWTTGEKSKTFSFYNENNYAMFRMVISQCQTATVVDATCPTLGVRIADLTFQVASINYNTICPSNGGFPSAIDQHYSYLACDSNYSGYRRRYCSNRVLGAIESFCSVSAPASFSYPQESYELVVNEEISPVITPSIVCADCTFTITPDLPSGMELNENTGELSGTPLNITDFLLYTITASNVAGMQTVTLNILSTNETVHCYMDLLNGWESTLVNTTAVKDCPSSSGYSGNMTRLCLPGSPARWDVVVDNCEVIVPNITLVNTTYSFVKNEQISPIVPVVTGYGIYERKIEPTLPAGLYFDPSTAAISGKPTQKIQATEFTITVRNANGEAHVTLTITVTSLVCSAEDGWSETDSGDTAYKLCPDNKEGDWYRVCQAGTPPTWQSPVDNCQYIKPVVSYSSSFYALQRNQATTIIPTTQFYISSWSYQGALPVGLSFSTSNGQISGTPTQETEALTVTITAANPDKQTQVTLSFSVSIFKCAAEGVWPETEAGQTVTRDCDDTTLKEGSISRACVSSGYGVSWAEPVDSCKYKAPILVYPVSTILARRGEAIQPVTPTIGNQIDQLTIEPTLPEGMAFHGSSGTISGTPTSEATSRAYVVTAINADARTTASLQITVTVVACPADGSWPMTERGSIAYMWCSDGMSGILVRQCGEEGDESPEWKPIDSSNCVANPSSEKPSQGQAFLRFKLQLEGVTSFDPAAYAAVRRVLAAGLSSLGVVESGIVLESYSSATFSVLAAGTAVITRIRVSDENVDSLETAVKNFAKSTLTTQLRISEVASLAMVTASVDENSFEVVNYTMLNSLVSTLLTIVIIMAVVLILIAVMFYMRRMSTGKKNGHDRLANSHPSGKHTKKSRYDDYDDEKPKKSSKKSRHFEDEEEEEERPKKKSSKKSRKTSYEEEEEEERPKKKSSKKSRQTEEYEEERPKKKSSKKSKHYEDSD